MMVVIATMCSLVALISGIAVIGSGKHWQYETPDFWRGKVNAWLYLWVIMSTIFSMGHFVTLLDYGMTWDWGYRHPETEWWMTLHTGVGVLFSSAHVGIKRYLHHGHGEQYMWGALRCAG